MGGKPGRPPTYKTPEEMQKKIDMYFEHCAGEMLRDEEGNPIYDKWGHPVFVNVRPPTVTGLALALGFTGRQALLNYQAKPQFVDTVTRAKSLCEEYAESRLYDRDGSRGAMFSLTNNFRGWSNHPQPREDSEPLKKAKELLEESNDAID